MALGFITGYTILQINSEKEQKISSSENDSNPQAGQNQKIARPPIDPEGNNVRFFGYTYTFSGIIKEFTEEGSNYKVVLQTQNAQIPSFVTNANTTVVKRDGSEDLPAEYSDVTNSSNVLIAAMYDAKNSRWRLNRIIILDTSLPATR